jgi:glycosyltransferase involved in cell wall biosynthesis
MIDNAENINNSSTKVSIIVPAYNTEKYISKCLSSLVNQTIKDIEIIIVNDGSTDNTKDIISSFANENNNIKIINQDNLKQGAARNNGIKIASGEYIGFVDSDDWVDSDYFEKLYCAAKKYDSDIALATNVRTGNGKTKKRISILKEEFITDMQGKMDACRLWKDGCPTNKIYRTNLLRKYNILYPEGVYCEDKIFTTKSVYYANGIVTVPDIYYYYFRNPDSTVNSKKGKRNKPRRNDRDTARREVLKFLKSQKAELRDGDFWATKKEVKCCNIPIFKQEESFHTARISIFGLKLFKYNLKENDNE